MRRDEYTKSETNIALLISSVCYMPERCNGLCIVLIETLVTLQVWLSQTDSDILFHRGIPKKRASGKGFVGVPKSSWFRFSLSFKLVTKFWTHWEYYRVCLLFPVCKQAVVVVVARRSIRIVKLIVLTTPKLMTIKTAATAVVEAPITPACQKSFGVPSHDKGMRKAVTIISQ